MNGTVTGADLPIDTERLRIRRFRTEDADALLALYGDPSVVRFLYSEPLQPDRLAEVLGRRLGAPKFESEGDTLELATELRDTGEFVGALTMFYRSSAHRRGEIGFVTAPRFTGRGFAQEGAKVLLRIGFGLVGFHRIEGRCDARNGGSAAVMSRIGMRQEAHFLEYEVVKGEWTDELVFALARLGVAEWDK